MSHLATRPVASALLIISPQRCLAHNRDRMFLEIMSQFSGGVENTVGKFLVMRIALLRGGKNFIDKVDRALLHQVRVFRLALTTITALTARLVAATYNSMGSSGRGAANMGGEVNATLSCCKAASASSVHSKLSDFFSSR